jgi:hypothetical protein
LDKSLGRSILMGVSVREFWLMEIYELNQALQEYEEERKERLMMWRMSNYIAARPHFDPKKHVPSMEEWHPFPWDKEYRKEVAFIPYDQQIEFAIKVGRPDWIPDFWYQNSEKYQHLATSKSGNGSTDTHDGHSGIEGAPIPA